MGTGKGNKLIIRDSRKEKSDKEKELEQKTIEQKESLEFNMPGLTGEAKSAFIAKLDKESKKVDMHTSSKIDSFRMSYIEDYEVEEAKKLIADCLGFEPPRTACGMMAVKIFVRPDEIAEFTREDGTKGQIVIPASVTAHDKFRNCSALVLSQGADCYQDRRYKEHWFIRLLRKFFNKWMPPCTRYPTCRVGDWVVIPRNEGTQVNYRGIPVQYIYDDRVIGTIEDPNWVTRD